MPGSEKKLMEKPRIGIFKYSCCAGCEFQLIYFQKHLLETFQAVDIVFCQMLLSSALEEGPFDVALVEGAITEAWQAEQLKKVRQVSGRMIAIGSCAVCGGVPAIKNNGAKEKLETRVYKDTSTLHSQPALPVDRFVKIDGYVKGCPMGERDLAELVVSLLQDKRPDFLETSVCVECKLKHNACVLVAYGEPCMGPVTNAGCDALCPTYGRACFSCWGPMRDANAGALADLFSLMGLEAEEILRKFTSFAQPAKEFEPVVGKKA